uniref:Alcohol dehydrogenase-like N-terminal domain-containing protein n=1 Tax=Cyprinus carpio TaxID=7962 RepID=A0A8C2CV00_CYPCA
MLNQVLLCPTAPLMMEEIEVTPPQEGEIQIKVVATGVCHTDLYHLFEGKDKRGFLSVLGHEGAGVVESVGPGVTDFKPGDKAIPLFLSQCGECKFCKCPKTNLCDLDIRIRIRIRIRKSFIAKYACAYKEFVLVT